MHIKHHGEGTILINDKNHEFCDSYYTGEFHKGEPSGKGTRFFDGERLMFNGHFSRGKMNG